MKQGSVPTHRANASHSLHFRILNLMKCFLKNTPILGCECTFVVVVHQSVLNALSQDHTLEYLARTSKNLAAQLQRLKTRSIGKYFIHFSHFIEYYLRRMRGFSFNSLCWLAKNTKPCPSCSSPIERSTGCNHMWCEGCRYYFCWICGGEGNKCLAYECHKQSAWASRIAKECQDSRCFESNEIILFYKVKYYEKRRECLNRDSSEDRIKNSIERQLCQVLLWFLTYDLQFAIQKYENRTAEYECARDRLELLVHFLNMEGIAEKHGISALDLITNFAKPRGNGRKITFDSKCKVNDVFREKIADHTLSELCRQNEVGLKITAEKAIIQAISLFKKCIAKRKCRQRKNRYGLQEPNGTASKINQMYLRRSQGPWQLGFIQVGL